MINCKDCKHKEDKSPNWFLCNKFETHLPVECMDKLTCKHAEEKVNEWEPKMCMSKYDNTHHDDITRHLRRTYKILCYVQEFGGDWIADWEDEDQGKWFVYFNTEKNKWFKDYNIHVKIEGVVYMSTVCAKKLVKDLNKGVVKV